jgi:hypothetical protein
MHLCIPSLPPPREKVIRRLLRANPYLFFPNTSNLKSLNRTSIAPPA